MRRLTPDARSPRRARGGLRRLVPDVVMLGIGALAALGTLLPPVVIERWYANGVYPPIDTAVRAITGPVPFAVGDVLAVALAVFLVVTYVRIGRLVLRDGFTVPRALVALGRIVLRTLAIAAVVGAWFLVSWGYGYSRLSLAAKVPVHDERTNEDTVTAFADHVVDELDANAAGAHRELGLDVSEVAARLRPTWLATIHRLGDVADFAPDRVKPTFFDRLMTSSGTTGFIDPWTHETSLATSLFPYELPAVYAHEWTHLAGFSDETEANYVAVISCTISHDPLLRYSGWMLVWFNLPDSIHPTHRFTRVPYDDVVAVRNRYLALIKPQVRAVTQVAYDHYLRANHVKAGYASYALFVRWMTGADYDRDGLPIVRPGVAKG